jgi:hypothetical protein
MTIFTTDARRKSFWRGVSGTAGMLVNNEFLGETINSKMAFSVLRASVVKGF